MLRNRKGFTLIELLIVVVIIGILAAIAIPKFANTKDQAKIRSTQSDVRNVMTAQEAYLGQEGITSYAADAATLGINPSQNNTITITGATGTGYTVKVVNSTVSSSSSTKGCTATIGGADPLTDGKIVCENVQ